MAATFAFVAYWWAVILHYSGWRAFEKYVNKYSGLGALFAAMISGIVVLWVARRYTKRIKQIDATLEFSRRFHELIQQQVELNHAYFDRRRWENWPPNQRELLDARAWWWRFFDLVLYEFDFYQSGFLRKERFTEWMKWRWLEARDPDSFFVSGMNYNQGWDHWRLSAPNQDNRLVKFLNQVHQAPTMDEMVKKVAAAGPRLFRRPHLN
jgi:hypothetical protein